MARSSCGESIHPDVDYRLSTELPTAN
jgi:hypothetical protein